ncbi:MULTISPECIES: FAD-binding oxidoreductase [Caballeronia]|uniref:NAD(P)/FAD-dependent oxidoreductase n=1 Tax=Caballeronia TaxID=1827195 RepID=UPI00045AD538|nr:MULTISPECIES: FAD-dependent oxidoreductase [Caballeronia]KAK45427.1 nopaline dehydrogenase [Caballeronia jiangsuensis]MCE4548067.1 FAD-binding oxidoreductase [Caballeronia sp. PC1]MCE4575905.1 FAD-binding oxidoreductase [Caballeronia sp. CLC5]
MSQEFDVIVVGAGMVGAAVGYGLIREGRRVLMLDGEDTDFRAAKANFGLVWAHGKGQGQPQYQRLSLEAANDWPQFAAQLEAESGMPVAYEQKGGLYFCLSEKEFSDRAARIGAWHAQLPEFPVSTRMIGRNELERLLPNARLGKDVFGASLGSLDGHVNPLRLLAAMQAAFLRRGGTLRSGQKVTSIKLLAGGGFEVIAGARAARAERVLVSAGLGSAALGPMVGLDVPIRPQRGQLLVTERLAPLLPLPASGLRQTGEGTVMIGVTQEEVGFDLHTTSDAAVRLARKAVQILPDLAKARLVRQWACLRIMTPDGAPIYASSQACPGADIAICHSGVTLASFHAGAYARALAHGTRANTFDHFHHGRFDVQKVA